MHQSLRNALPNGGCRIYISDWQTLLPFLVQLLVECSFPWLRLASFICALNQEWIEQGWAVICLSIAGSPTLHWIHFLRWSRGHQLLLRSEEKQWTFNRREEQRVRSTLGIQSRHSHGVLGYTYTDIRTQIYVHRYTYTDIHTQIYTHRFSSSAAATYYLPLLLLHISWIGKRLSTRVQVSHTSLTVSNQTSKDDSLFTFVLLVSSASWFHFLSRPFCVWRGKSFLCMFAAWSTYNWWIPLCDFIQSLHDERFLLYIVSCIMSWHFSHFCWLISETKHKWKSLTMKVRSPRSTPTISQLSFEYSDMCEGEVSHVDNEEHS